jgi:hypothetical protein
MDGCWTQWKKARNSEGLSQMRVRDFRELPKSRLLGAFTPLATRALRKMWTGFQVPYICSSDEDTSTLRVNSCGATCER